MNALRRPSWSALGAAEIALAAITSAATALLYADYFVDRRYLPVTLGAAAGGALVAVLTRRWRAEPAALAGIVGFVGFAIFAVYTPTLRSGLPSLRSLSELGTGLLHGWARMLTVNLPTDASPALLITPVALVWAAAMISVGLAVRTRSVLGPTVPPVLAVVAGLLLTAARAGGGLIVVAVFLLALLVLVLVRVVRLDQSTMDPARRVGVAGRFAFGVPAVLVIATLGAAGAYLIPIAPGSDRFDPRTVVPLRVAVDDHLTPLATLKSQLREQPARTLFTVELSADARLDRVRTAALDRFDGALWTSDDNFLVAGRSLARDPGLQRARLVTLKVTLDTLEGPYLPAAGWPVRIDATGVGFSDASGVLVSNVVNLHGLTYELVAEVRADDSGLGNAAVGNPPDVGRYTDLPPGLPPEIQQRAADLTSNVTGSYAKLRAIEEYLHRLPYSLDARPGHSYDALRRLFSSNPQDRVGYAEQYASAFAVMARSLGFPTRVATGYLLRSERRSGDTYVVTTAEAHAWAEVNLAGYGWVTFEPTNFSARADPRESQPPPDPGPADRPQNNVDDGSVPGVDPNAVAGPSTTRQIIAGALVTLAVIGALVVLLPTLVVLEKLRRRRRRRRRGPPAARVIGAWRETADRLVEHGVTVSRASTPIEVAADAGAILGERAGAVATLAPIVTEAVFAPDPPDDAIVREAWLLNRQVRRDLREHRLARAALAWLDPRPLVGGWRDTRRRRRAMSRLRGG